MMEMNVGNKSSTEEKEANIYSKTVVNANRSSYTMPVTYTWENIEAEVDIVQGNIFNKRTIQNRILNHVSGAVKPGEFLAIMGSSGAGKTVLLDSLALKYSDKVKIRGDRRINGIPVDMGTLARISGYIQQEDMFVGNLKVEEVLRFQALLMMDPHFSYQERMVRVEEVISEFGLTKCRKTFIGHRDRGIKGISIGERKRLAFACEVLTNPSLMFCDEPASGLDSYMARNVIQALKNLAAAGTAVICTIHQPSSEVFTMFDRILLLTEGRTAFQGPTNEALSFFASQGMLCPINYNPADFYIFSLALIPGREIECQKKNLEICAHYEQSEYRSRVQEIQRENHHQNSSFYYQIDGMMIQINNNKSNSSRYRAGWFPQFRAVFWRSWITATRDPFDTIVKIGASIFLALLVAVTYQGQRYDIVNSIGKIQGSLFFLSTMLSWQTIFSVIYTFTLESPIFLREHFNGMYRTDVYFLSKTLAELLIFIVCSIILITIPYYIIGFTPYVERFMTCTVIMVLATNVASSFSYIISCLAPSPQFGVYIAVPMVFPLFLFGGVFVKNGSVPVYLDWIRYLSWFMYTNEALAVNQWQGVAFNNPICKSANFSMLSISQFPQNTSEAQDFFEIVEAFKESITCHGEDILKRLNFKTDFFLRDILCMCGLVIIFRFIAFLILLAKSYRKL